LENAALAEKRANEAQPPGEDWGTAAARVKWLVEHRYQGNRSAFAEKVGVSHTAVSKVVAGRPPGRRLLEKIARELKVSPAWLLTGEGEPSTEPPGQGGVPVARKLLPGSPLEHPDLLLGDWVDDAGRLFAPSQYWLVLTSAQPIVRDPQRGFRVGDHLLMETARDRFPRKRQLDNHLCVVRFPGGEAPELKLALVEFYPGAIEEGPDRLEADTFESDPDPSVLVKEVVYRHYPGGKITQYERPLKLTQYRGKERAVPLDEIETEPMLPKIRYAAIVAVWLQILRRPGNVPL
jgi:transcriptional regulator with XRE-family HTH domain